MLCGETYSSRVLYKCRYCNGIYCGNCILTEEGRSTICLRCAVKKISPRLERGSKYAGLSILLSRMAKFYKEITLSFAKIEDAIGDRLPKSAYENRGWWSNLRGRSPSEAWLTVGWRVKDANLEDKIVTFVREETPIAGTAEGAKRHKIKRDLPSTDFKNLAVKAKINLMKNRKPSKTKIAILQARLKNLERARRTRKSSKVR